MTIYNKTLFFTGAIIFLSIFVYTAVKTVSDNFYYDLAMVVGILIMILGLRKPREVKP
jgi:uncharacterized membrane protein YiaA